MTIRLTPLFECKNGTEHLETIEQNLAAIGGAIYCSDGILQGDYIRQLEQATSIENKAVRDHFLDVVRSLKYVRQQCIEAHNALNCVRAQVKSMITAAKK